MNDKGRSLRSGNETIDGAHKGTVATKLMRSLPVLCRERAGSDWDPSPPTAKAAQPPCPLMARTGIQVDMVRNADPFRKARHNARTPGKRADHIELQVQLVAIARQVLFLSHVRPRSSPEDYSELNIDLKLHETGRQPGLRLGDRRCLSASRPVRRGAAPFRLCALIEAGRLPKI
jgi:hypothetical protein